VTPPKITIEASIDGRSRLILRENTAQWHHLEFAAPGRLNGANLPTRFNDSVVWLPIWPDQPTIENRDCNCRSDVFTGVTPAIPHQAVEARFNGRNGGTVVQSPSASNDFTLILEFNDTAGAAASYIVSLDWQSP
jgi:hypothetical protein